MDDSKIENLSWSRRPCMRRALYAIAIAALATGIVACSKDPSTTNADSLQPRSVPAEAVAYDVKPEPKPEPPPKAEPKPVQKITVPAGTKLHVALLEAVSSDDSHPGDQF